MLGVVNTEVENLERETCTQRDILMPLTLTLTWEAPECPYEGLWQCVQQ